MGGGDFRSAIKSNKKPPLSLKIIFFITWQSSQIWALKLNIIYEPITPPSFLRIWTIVLRGVELPPFG